MTDNNEQLDQQLHAKLTLNGNNAAADTNSAPASKPLSFGGFNFGAPSFVPNASAMDFVPTFLPSQPEPVISTATNTASVVSKPAPATVTLPKKTEPTKKPAVASSSAKSSAQSLSATPAASKPVHVDESAPPQLSAEELEAEEEFYKNAGDGKEHYNVVFIGHVDAGKSTMGGNILFLTGQVDKRTLEKYEREAKEQGRESWYLSWALDLNAEERAKGKTVECGRAFFETEKRRFTILDAPGHKSYVPNMISGASQADIAVLVISARKGEFETGFEKGGQTREHAMLAKTAGVKRLVVVINKMDDPTVEWSKERYDECCSKLLPFLKQCGYNPKTDLDFMPISGFTGANLKDRLTSDACSWYSGPSLLEFLDTVTGIDRKSDGTFMMPISEKYRDMGTIVSGKIECGRVRKGKQLIVMPNKQSVEILAIYAEQDDELKTATCGDNIRLRLKGIEEEDVHRGFVLCESIKPVHTAHAFEAQLMILEHKNIICAGYTAVLHVHTVVEEISIGALLHLVDKKTNRRSKKPPMFVKKGQVVVARIECSGPICLETYDDCPQLGRFTLRDEGKTVAMGKVTKLIEPN